MRTKTLLALSFAILGFTSCSKDNNKEQLSTETKEAYIDATSKTTWNYFSLSENKIVGTGEENEADNKKWASRTDWDLAVNRYNIRTNSGASTSSAAKGGVHTLSSTISFNSVTEVPTNADFAVDKAITSEGMGGVTTTTVQSEAAVILFKKNEDGTAIMPPVYLQAPVYIFRTANGSNYFKVQFTQYQNESKVTGHVKFNSAQIK